jgi:hypothetical protein
MRPNSTFAWTSSDTGPTVFCPETWWPRCERLLADKRCYRREDSEMKGQSDCPRSCFQLGHMLFTVLARMPKQ